MKFKIYKQHIHPFGYFQIIYDTYLCIHMKKTLLLLSVAIASAWAGRIAARTYNDVRIFEYEIATGIQMPFKGELPHAKGVGYGWPVLAEIRMNVPGTGFDIGFQGKMHVSYIPTDGTHSSTHINEQNISITTYFDYSFRYWKKISLFAGIGIGAQIYDYDYHFSPPSASDRCTEVFTGPSVFTAKIRAGAEFWTRLRLTLEYQISARNYSYLGLTVGFVLNGGYRDRKK